MTNSLRYVPPPKKNQFGVSAVEFSFIFGLLFTIFWAVLSYALPFFLYQVMNQATAETARYALRIDPSQSNAVIINLAQTRLTQELNVLPPRFRRSDTLVSSVTVQTIDGFRTLVVTLTYPGCSSNNKTACVVPPINLVGFSIPNLSSFSTSSRLRLENM